MEDYRDINNWKHSEQRSDGQNNDYYFYPQNDDDFKREAIASGRIILKIVSKNDANKEVIEHPLSVNTFIKGDVATRVRTSTINGTDISKKFKDSIIYAVPANYIKCFEIITKLSNNTMEEYIRKYKLFKESENYDEKYKWDYIQKNSSLLEGISNIDNFKINLNELLDAKSNLMTHELLRQTRMFKEILEKHTEELQNLFKKLFDETISIEKRVDDFTNGLIELRDKIDWDYSITSQTAAFFLFVKYPAKYPVYSKVSVFHSYFEYFNIEEYLKFKNRSNGLRYQKLVEYINNELIPIMDEVLGNENSALDAQDFIWFVGNNISSQKEEITNQKKYWIYAAGENSSKWDEFHSEKIMAIGWDEIGNLSDYKSKSEIKNKMKEIYGEENSYKNDAHATWQFVNEMNIGDIVFVKKGRDKIIGRGIVESSYIYDVDREEFKNTRKVNWTHNEEKEQLENQNVLKTLTDITPYTDYYKAIEALFLENAPLPEQDDFDEYSEEDFLNDVFMDAYEYKTIKHLLKVKKNVILQGPPGVGKTYAAKKLAYSLIGKKDINKVKMIQFHQSYSYEDFIMGFRPTQEGGFKLEDGPFYEFCKEASEDTDNDYFFIIDEINRGNLSKIFGELLMLIESDKRKESLRLLYRNEQFNVPSNVHIIGMMNTADRSLAMIDYALRRRFAFYDFIPAFEKDNFKAYLADKANEKFDALISTIILLNKAIINDNSLGEGFRIGHSYFCTKDLIDDKWLNSVVNYEIIPLLKEYWFDEPSKIEEWSEKLKSAIK